MTRSAWELIFGFRDDIDLSSRWWHRLAKVVYGLLVFAVLGFMWLFKDDIKPDANLSNVEIIAGLNDAVLKGDKSVPNVIPTFLSGPGELGSIDESARSI